MTQQFIIPPRTSDGNEVRKFYQRVCQLLNKGLEVDNSLARAYLTSNQAINHNEATAVAGYTESLDTGVNFNPTTGIYTAAVAGKFQVDWNINFYDAESKLTLALSQILHNAAAVSYGPYWSGTDKAYVGSPGSDMIEMAVGDTLQLVGYMQTSDSSAAVMSAGVHTKMAVQLITRD